MAEANPNMDQQSLESTDEDPGYEKLELEILESYEVDEETALQEKRKSCQKNPGHKDFIPVKDFTREHLPEGFRAQLLLDFVMALIGLTVKVVMKKVSSDRPDNYHMSQFRGKRVTTVGSGMIFSVERKFEDPPREGEYCPCPHCDKLPLKNRMKQWGQFTVTTAKHVMFDDEESKHTHVEVDYDTDTDRDACPKLYGLEMTFSSFEKEEDMTMDECDLYVVSHEMKVCYMLQTRLGRYNSLREDIENNWKFTAAKNPPVVCVSHPHGMSKHVSVGDWTGQQITFPCRWRYTTCTCPGSSGAPIFKLGRALGENLPGHLTRHRGESMYAGVNESGRFTNWLTLTPDSAFPVEPEDRRLPDELRLPQRRNRPSLFFK